MTPLFVAFRSAKVRSFAERKTTLFLDGFLGLPLGAKIQNSATSKLARRASALSVLNLGVAEVVRLQKTQNSYEFGYLKIKT